jgi:hypothetical protein
MMPNSNAFIAAGKIDSLVSMVRFWPTPNAGLGKQSTKAAYWQNRIAKDRQVDLQMAVFLETGSGTLNPAWVEWLMGFPIGHSALQPSETP